MFTVLVAADVLGTKMNFEVNFPVVPTLQEIMRQAESIYTAELAASRAGPFAVGRFQLYDDRRALWVDLTSPSQLFERCQLYALPPDPRPLPATLRPLSPRAATRDDVIAVRPPLGAVAPPAVPVLHDNATHDDKTRVVFEEFDSTRSRSLRPEDLRRGFELLHVDFSTNTISDLIAKADANRDGVISFPEWQRFTEGYPTLTDSLYYRLKAYWEDVKRQQDIGGSKELLAELREREQQAKLAWLEAQRDSDAARSRLSAQEAALAQASDAQRAAEQALLEARRDRDRSAADRNARENELMVQREREARAAAIHADTVADTESAQRRLAMAQAETAAAMDRERHAAAVLAETQAEVERQRALTAQRTAEVADARSREQGATLGATEAARDTTLAGERLARADLDVAAKQQREKELHALHNQAQGDTAHAAARRDEEARALQIQREAEESAHLHRLDAQRVAEDADRMVIALEAENAAFNQKRRTVEEQEAPLLEQEIRLRAQRDSLEEKEAKLRGDHRSFCETTMSAISAGSVAAANYHGHAPPPMAVVPPSPSRAGLHIASPRTVIHSVSPHRELRELREIREVRDIRDFRDVRDVRDIRDIRGAYDHLPPSAALPPRATVHSVSPRNYHSAHSNPPLSTRHSYHPAAATPRSTYHYDSPRKLYSAR
eukprot:Sspe_Gene.82247::Locus_53897_Transcript_1_1_Confidence_1.000_Length_2148::g.82247::m.82247